MGIRMKKILMTLLLIINCNNQAASYLISNGGSQDAGDVALYDTATNNSVLIRGYSDTMNDNGHCAQGQITDGQQITILIPEDLSKFGYINSSCAVPTATPPNYSAFCPVFCNGIITQDTVIEQNVGTKTVCSSTQTPGFTAIPDPDNPGSTIYCGQQTTTVPITLQVSPICQLMASYLINNFADPNSTFYKIAEYAQCSTSATSYCAVSFTPKSEGFKVRINTDLLSNANHATPASCSQSNNNLTCQFTEKDGSTKNSCGFVINDDVYGSGTTALNTWFSQGANGNPPTAYFQNCTNTQPVISMSEINKIYAPQLHNLLNIRLRIHGFPVQLPVPMPFILSPLQKAEIKKYREFTSLDNIEKYMKYNNFITTQTKSLVAQYTSTIEKKIQEGIPCVASYSSDANGNPLVIYTCITKDYNPNYTCNFVYSASVSSGQFNFVSSNCSFPVESFIFQSPTLNPNENFDCGFCSVAEINTVGANKVGNDIESSLGNPGELYPFKTNISTAPTCGDGFVANL